jgi:hypothetical protein
VLRDSPGGLRCFRREGATNSGSESEEALAPELSIESRRRNGGLLVTFRSPGRVMVARLLAEYERDGARGREGWA